MQARLPLVAPDNSLSIEPLSIPQSGHHDRLDAVNPVLGFIKNQGGAGLEYLFGDFQTVPSRISDKFFPQSRFRGYERPAGSVKILHPDCRFYP